MEGGGFALYAAALALAPLALVQSIAAGGIGLLAFLSVRLSAAALGPRQLAGVILAVLGLVALAISLANGSGGEGHSGSTLAVVAVDLRDRRACRRRSIAARPLACSASPSPTASPAGCCSPPATSPPSSRRRAARVSPSSCR